MLKKTALFALVCLLVAVVGCSQKRVHLTGDSDNWVGIYEANLDKNSKDTMFKFTYKGTDPKKVKDVKIIIDDNKIIMTEPYLPENKTIKIPSKCSGCEAKSSQSIKVSIAWNEKEEDVFNLTDK